MIEEKKEALCGYLAKKYWDQPIDRKGIKEVGDSNGQIFSWYDEKYYVLTDQEADDLAARGMLKKIHLLPKDYLNEKIFRKELPRISVEKVMAWCDSENYHDFVLGMVYASVDFETFLEDVKKTFGRAFFIDEKSEETRTGENFFIYRIRG